MYKFVHSPHFAKLNIGYALDAGMATPDDDITVFFGERCFWSKV